MSEFSMSAGAFLLTYLIHSTLLLGAAWLAMRAWRHAKPETRELMWKAALVGAVLTSSLATLMRLPRLGLDFAISSDDRPPIELARYAALPDTPAHELPTTVAAQEEGIAPTNVSPAKFDVNDRAPTREASVTQTSTVIPSHTSDLKQSSLTWSVAMPPLIVFWLLGCAVAFTRLARRFVDLRRLRRASRPADRDLSQLVQQTAAQMGLRGYVDIRLCGQLFGPMVAGLLRWRLFLPERFVANLDRQQLKALLAHELAHLTRRDPWWNLVGELICGVFFFQPLNFVARRQIRIQAEFLADRRSAATLEGGLGLARCLTAMAEWSLRLPKNARRINPVAVGMGAYRSTFGQRIHQLLSPPNEGGMNSRFRLFYAAWLLVALALVPFVAPRALAMPQNAAPHNSGETNMTHSKMTSILGGLALALGFAGPASPDDAPSGAAVSAAAAEDTDEPKASELPEGVRGFSGQVAGIVVGRTNDGVLFKAAKVVRVWERANKARDPESLEGKTLLVRPIGRDASLQAKFVSKMKVGDDYRLELQNREGSVFVIVELTEEQREIAAGEADSPREGDQVDRTVVPESLFGLSGRVIGRLVSKDTEKGELTLQILKTDRVWPGNKAKNPKSAEGRTLKVEGVFGRFLDVLLTLKEGDGVQIEVKHVSGNSLRFLGEGLEKVSLEDSQEREERERKDETKTSSSENVPTSQSDNAEPAGMNGFRGMMIGKVVSKDVEKGVLVFKMEKVTRVWKQNKAPKPELSVGKPLTVEGISGKFLDVLLVLEPGDGVEVEAFHVRGPHLSFPGEWLKKIE